MIFVTYLLLILLNFIFQSTILPHLSIMGIMPNTVITIIISVGLLRGSFFAAVFGFIAGLLPDIFFGDMIGLNAMLFMTIGYVSGFLHKDFYAENYILPFILTLLINFAYCELIFLFRFLMNSRTDFTYYLFRVVIPEVVYTSFFSFVIYRLVYAIDKFAVKRAKREIWQ